MSHESPASRADSRETQTKEAGIEWEVRLVDTHEIRCVATSLKLEQEIENTGNSWCLWLTPVSLATQEAESRRIMVQSQPGLV
jgi:hypothetical protein